MQSVSDITEDIKIGNTSIRQLINEAGDTNATPEQIALEYLIEGDPIEIKFDDEMSTSTASLRRLSEGASVSPRCFSIFSYFILASIQNTEELHWQESG